MYGITMATKHTLWEQISHLILLQDYKQALQYCCMEQWEFLAWESFLDWYSLSSLNSLMMLTKKNHSCILWFGQVLILTWCNESRWAHIWTPDKCVPLHMFHCSIWRTQYYSPQHFRKILQNLGKKNILRLIQPAVEKPSYYSKDFWKISLTCHMICCYRHMKTYIWLNFCRIILSNALPSFCVNAMCAKSSDVSLFQTEWQWKRYDAVQNLLCRKRST